jgi:hypothetical protein
LILRPVRLLAFGCLVALIALPLRAAPGTGRISGVVVDGSGIPQLGATVLVSAEQLSLAPPVQVRTNERGHFSAAIPAGTYSVKVTLAGFLPTMAQHVEVTGRQVTLLEIVLGSVYSSIEKLRRPPNQQPASDDWTWVLRTAAASRSVLQWQDDPPASKTPQGQTRPSTIDSAHAELAFASGSNHPGSLANFTASPSTAFVYGLEVGPAAQFLMAGQTNYGGSLPMGALAAEWIPSGKPNVGSVTSLVVRESRLSLNGPAFRGLRLSHDDQLVLGNRVTVRYGAEYVVAGFQGSTTAIRPRAEVAVRFGGHWLASAVVAKHPWQDEPSSSTAIASTLEALDTFPTLMMRRGRPVLEDNLHEEFAVRRDLRANSSITASVFHDASTHTAVIGRSSTSAPEFLQGYLSQAFAYDGGSSSSAGMRLAFKKSFGDDVSTALIYTYAGALAPDGTPNAQSLRSALDTKYRQGVAGRVSATIPRLQTQLRVSYKWLSGPTVSQQDGFGESIYHIDPYLGLQVRQPLPRLFPGRMEVGADVGNLLAQGYLPISTSHGNIVAVPAYRYVRGGLSLEF